MPLDAIRVTETLSESSRSVVVRGVDEDGRAVVIKRPHAALPLAECRPRFLNERMIYEQVESSRALRLRSFIDQGDELALVFDDPGCRSLPAHARQRPLSVLDTLEVTLGILDALVGLHRAHVVHRDVKPDNVLVDASLSRILLIDFGIASVVERATGIASKRGRLEGTLEFIAPELTGRVNRGADYRSDYYCLGATMYWMLAGESPFGRLELSELVHAHIARVPERLDVRNPAIPRPVASIVAKLLAKSPDERYQGAFGLRRDLERCMEALARDEPLHDFALAVLDPSERLTLTRRAYGRSRELDALESARERSRSSPQLVVVSGPAGCGRTTLVEEFRASVEASGEQVQFMQHKLEAARGEPMAAIKNTLSRLLRRYERGPASLRDAVHQRLHTQLDETGAALAEVLPELGLILGPRPELPVVDPGAARTRFWASVGRYASALLLPDHEYILFIDDLQWADEASRHLVEHLLAGDQRVLVIVTVPDDDAGLDEVHAWLHNLPGTRQTLELGPLGEGSLREWAQALLGDAAEASAFAQLLLERTRGIPLFVEQTVVALHDAGAISIDHATGCWTVDLTRARAQQASGDVVEFLVGRLRELPPKALNLLGLAAHVGVHFDLPTLASLANVTEADLATSLYEASAAGFLLENYRASAPTFTFVHERIRHAAAHSCTEDPAQLHLALAQRMLESDPATQDPEIIHVLASHVANTCELITDPDERQRFAEMCIRAAKHARAAATFVNAALHYETATRLLDDDTSHELLFDSLLALAECRFMAGDTKRGAQAYRALDELARSRLERARVLLSREQLLMIGEDIESCLNILVEAAALFELDLRGGGSPEWVGALMQRVLASLAQRSSASLMELPLIRAPELEVLLALLLAATKPAYVSGDLGLMTALTLTIIETSLEHGCSDASATAFMQLALLCASALEDFDAARRYSAIAFALFDRFPSSVLGSFAAMTYAVTVQPWIAPVGPDNSALREQFHELRNAGMLTDAGYAINTLSSLALLLGAPLETTLQDARLGAGFSGQTGARSIAVVMATAADACCALMDHEPGAGLRARGEDAAAVELHPTDTYQSCLHAAFVAWMLRDDEALAQAIAAGRPARIAGTGLFSTGLFDVLDSMLACAGYADLDDDRRRELAATLDARFAQLARWEASSPTNAAPLRSLLAGAWAQARGQLDEAFSHFDAAANAAANAGWVSIEARANEHAADVLVARDQPKLAVGYFEHARRCYARWGARAAVRRLGEGPLSNREAPRTKPASSHTSSSDTQLTLDISALVKMAETMSKVTSVEDVVIALLDGTVKNAGADRGVLLLDDEGGLHVAGVFERNSSGARHVDAVPLADASDQLAESLINEAASGTEPIVVDDGPLDERVAHDPWVVASRPRSLLALPIVKQERHVGVLYLENSMLSAVFSALDLQILMTLARQAAIALDNARLFDALREREARWRSLVDNAPDFIAIVDRDHRFEFVNRLDHGLDATHVLGMTAEQFLDPSHANVTRAAIDRVLAHGTHEFYEARVSTPSGVRHLSTRLGPIKRGDVIDRVTLITADRTHQHQLEEQLRQAQKMQAIGTLAGGVAHDFNNLLTVVLGACELAMMQLDDPGEVEISLVDIRDAAERAANLTRQLLAFSRRQVLKPRRVDLNALVTDIAKLLRRLIGENIELRLELATTGAWVHVDPSQLEQVLMNLVVNARDAMPDGGALAVRTRRSQIDAGEPQAPHAVEPGTYVILEVEDDGLGIAADQLGRIFEPFFTTKPAGSGTGLGLSTVLGIVEQSGGSLFVDSEPGRGTQFCIYLPFGDGTSEQPTLAVPAPINEVSSRKVILVVEDEATVRSLTARMLRGLGYEVMVASNGDEAEVVAAQADAIDLLLVDVVMPGANGRELADRIVNQWPNMKVLYMSGYTDDAIVRHGVLDGTRAFLQKPFSRQSLAHAIAAALRNATLERQPEG
ncbi:protein kinase domain-containing protein [Enhygromyxa salina]|nr:AAA family ATPase [Enhygromyxa salina]